MVQPASRRLVTEGSLVEGPAWDALQPGLSASIEEQTVPLFVPKSANTWAWLGDSISDFMGLTANGTRENTRSASGFGAWADVLTGHRTNTVINASVVGQTTEQMLAKVSQVIAQAPAVCHILGGTNDQENGVALATVTANLLAIVTALQEAGIRVVIGTIPPQTDYGSNQAIHNGINAWIRNLPATRPDVIVADYAKALTGPDNYWGRAEYTYDGTHPTRRGAYAMALVLKPIIERLIPAREVLPIGVGDSSALKVSNFLTRDGSNIPNDGEGVSWVGTPGTCSMVAVDSDDPIQVPWWQVVIPDGANGADIIMNVNLPGGIPGTAIESGIEYKVSGIQQPSFDADPLVGWELSVQGYAGAFTGQRAQELAYYVDRPNAAADAGGNFPIFGHQGVMLTPPHVTTDTATLAQARIRLRGGQTIKFRRWTIRSATQPAVALLT